MTGLKKEIIEAVLPLLRELDPRAAECDLLFFGKQADICSPLPQKYGLDMLDGIVYNLENRATIYGQKLFSSAEVTGGFIDLTVSCEALGAIVRAVSCEELLPPSGVIRIGTNPECLRARLLDVVFEAAEEGALPSKNGVARRALWHIMNADSASSLSVAMKETETALFEHRKAALGVPGCERISRSAARAMAVSLQAFCFGAPND